MATRVQPSLLSPLERPLLAWLAARLPRSATPDTLTGIGLLGAMASFACYLLARHQPFFLWFASLGLLANWFGDSLDGTLARHRHIERLRYGFFVDHVTDLFSQLFIGLGLAFCGYIRPEAGGLALIVYLMAVATTVITQSVTGEMAQSVFAVGPTEIRCIIVALNTWLYFFPSRPLPGEEISALDAAILVFCLLGLLAIAGRAAFQARLLAQQEKSKVTALNDGQGP